MHDIIKIIVDENHFLRCPVDTIARDGEGNVIKLEITFPEKLSSYWVYVDFKMPDGEKFKSPRLDVDGNKATYLVPPYVLIEGKLKLQVLFQNEHGAIWKSYKKPFNVRGSINAVDDIPEKEDFIVEAQKALDNISDKLPLVVTCSGNGGQASHTSAQIYDHLQKGGDAILYVDHAGYFGLSSISDTTAKFSAVISAESYNWEIGKSGRCTRTITSLAAQKSVDDTNERVDETNERVDDTNERVDDIDERVLCLEDHSTLIVTCDVDTDNPSHTAEQIYDHITNGGTVRLERDGNWYDLAYCDNNYAMFTHLGAEGYSACFEIAGANSGILFPKKPEWKSASADSVKALGEEVKKLKEGQGGIGTLIVTYDPETLKASHNAWRIYEHIQNGGTVVLINNGGVMAPLTGFDRDDDGGLMAVFSASVVLDSEACLITLTVDDGASVAEHAFNPAEKEKVDNLEERLGDIDTALDSIIAIQESLIGGDGE